MVEKIKVFLKNNKLLIFLYILSLGTFFYSLDGLKPHRDYTKRKQVACEIVKHLGFTDDLAYIKIKHGSFTQIKTVGKHEYFQFEDGHSYYFSLSEQDMFPVSEKEKQVAIYFTTFFLIEASIVFISSILGINKDSKYFNSFFLSVILILIQVVLAY